VARLIETTDEHGRLLSVSCVACGWGHYFGPVGRRVAELQRLGFRPIYQRSKLVQARVGWLCPSCRRGTGRIKRR
jgi:hypothetical protein